MSIIAKDQKSLLDSKDGEPSQMSLLDLPEELLEKLTNGKEGQFTGELLFDRDPDKYRAIVAAMAGGLSIRKTAKALRVSPGTITAIRDREGLGIGAQKKGIVATLQLFAAAGAERLLEELHDIPIDRLPVALGIAVDKMQLLAGEATAIIDERKTVSFEDYAGLLAQLSQDLPSTGTTTPENSAIEKLSGDPDSQQPLTIDADPIDSKDSTPETETQGLPFPVSQQGAPTNETAP